MTFWERCMELRWFVLAFVVALALFVSGAIALNAQVQANKDHIQTNSDRIEQLEASCPN